MTFSSIPLIFLVEALAILYATRAATRRGMLSSTDVGWIAALIALLAAWGGACVYLGINGAFQSDRFVETGAPYWLPFVPVVLIVLPMTLLPQVRGAARKLIDATPLHALIAIHGLRVLAIGGIIKAWNGEFSAPVAGLIGFPDFLFGVSALILAWLAFRQKVGTWAAVTWNAIGATIIVPNVLIVTWLSFPGPWQLFSGEPTVMTLFAFPMALAPALVVPVFVMMNMFVAARLIERWFEARNAGPRAKLELELPGSVAKLDA
jgi:hypothetical protein